MKRRLREDPAHHRQPAMHGGPDSHASYLWTPWRMASVTGTANREEGCIFCNRLASSNDVDNLLIFRGERVFSIMNLYPYNTGHLMIVPNAHVPSPEALDAETLAASARLMQRSIRALRMALSCEGFNVGLNIGVPAGAGVAEHMHQHIVPRWTGDANFMPILGGTMVMPELLPVTYAKVRAEMFRDDNRDQPVVLCCFDPGSENVAVETAQRAVALPVAHPSDELPVWRTAYQLLVSAGIDAQLTGWGGSELAGPGQRSGLMFELRTPPASPTKLQFMPIEDALQRLAGAGELDIVQQALKRCRTS